MYYLGYCSMGQVMVDKMRQAAINDLPLHCCNYKFKNLNTAANNYEAGRYNVKLI